MSGDPGGERGLARSTVSSGPLQNQFGGAGLSGSYAWRRCGLSKVHINNGVWYSSEVNQTTL